MKTLSLLVCATAVLLTMPACVSVERKVETEPTTTSSRTTTAVSTDLPYQRSSRSTTTTTQY